MTHSRRNVLVVIGLRMAENGASSIYASLAISYIVAVTGVTGPIGAIALACASLWPRRSLWRRAGLQTSMGAFRFTASGPPISF